MELAFMVYLISILNTVRDGLIGFGFAFVIAAFAGFLFSIDSGKPPKWLIIPSVIFAFLCFGLRMVLPTEKAGYVIAGAYATQKIGENKNVQEVGGKVLTIINQKLDKTIDDGVKLVKDKVEETVKEKP